MYNMPVVDIYNQKLCEPLFHRLKREPFTKVRQAELQASYYQRRGWFLNKKRFLFKRIGAGRETIFSYPNR